MTRRRPHRRDERAAGSCRSRTPAEIYEQPNSRWVADFIGDVNLIEGRVASSVYPAIVMIESAAGGRLRGAHAAEPRRRGGRGRAAAGEDPDRHDGARAPTTRTASPDA